jgi:hypothetical protein
MSLKMDKFTWAIVVVVIVLLVSAVATIGFTGGEGWRSQEAYKDEDSPVAAVHNAYVAYLQGDPITGRQYYSKSVLEEDDRSDLFRTRYGGYYVGDRNQRLRILSVETPTEDTALIAIAIDRYTGGGLFDSGSTWTERQTLPLVREDGSWKINTLVFF